MRVFIDSDYKAGEVINVPNPSTGKLMKVVLPVDYGANSWVEIPVDVPPAKQGEGVQRACVNVQSLGDTVTKPDQSNKVIVVKASQRSGVKLIVSLPCGTDSLPPAIIRMAKIRTIIPVNAKPGISIIRVVNPKTNAPTRVRVPANAQPGQMIELDLQDTALVVSDSFSADKMTRSRLGSNSLAVSTQNITNPISDEVNLSPIVLSQPIERPIPSTVRQVSQLSIDSTLPPMGDNSQPPIAQCPPPSQIPLATQFTSSAVGQTTPIGDEKAPLLSNAPYRQQSESTGEESWCSKFWACLNCSCC